MNASVRYTLGKSTSLQVSGFNLTGAHDQPYFGLQSGVPAILADGLFGALPAINIGPATFNLTLSQSIGR